MACGAALAMFVLSFAQIMAYGFPLLTTWITLRKHTDLAGMKKEFITTYEYNPEFFPTTIDELAGDAFDSIQLGLISKINRLRIDIRLDIIEKERNLLLFLVKLSALLVDDEIKKIRVVVRPSLVDKISNLYNELLNATNSTMKNNISFSNLVDSIGDTNQNIKLDKLYVVFNPDNVYDDHNVLENFQALCFQASLHNIPTIIINPFLVSTSWSDSGHRPPLILSDFINAYFICDDYFMVNVNSYCGIVQRAAQTDLYLLNNFKNDELRSFKRIKASVNTDGSTPESMHDAILDVLLTNEDFPIIKMYKEKHRNPDKRNGIIESNDEGNTIVMADLLKQIR